MGDMMITRRLTLVGAAAALTSACETLRAEDAEAPNALSEDRLQSGDLIFPRRPGSTVIYKSTAGLVGLSGERRAWEAAKSKVLSDGKAGDVILLPSDQLRLRETSYEEFLRGYSAPATAAVLGDTMTSLGLTTGHVAIVVREGDRLEVVEAVPGVVVRRPYEAFKEEHRPDMLWQARLRGHTDQQRAAFARVAASKADTKYDIMTFDLLDDSCFYCSKLVWWAAWHSLGKALDGNSNPRRGASWFSPKKLLNLSSVEKIVDPGRY